MIIKGKLISLNTYTIEQCHKFYQCYISDPTMTDKPHHYRKEDVDKYFNTRITDDSRYLFAINLEGKTIGEIQLKYIDHINKTGTLSIVLSDDTVKNKGYGTEAQRLLINYAFLERGFKKILADTVRRNDRSKHVLKKLGFTHTHDDDLMNYFEINNSDWQY